MTNYAREFCARERLFGTERASVWMQSKVKLENQETRQYDYELTENQVNEIRVLHINGYGANKIAAKVNVPSSAVIKQINMDIKLGVVPELTGGEKISIQNRHKKMRIEA